MNRKPKKTENLPVINAWNKIWFVSNWPIDQTAAL